MLPQQPDLLTDVQGEAPFPLANQQQQLQWQQPQQVRRASSHPCVGLSSHMETFNNGGPNMGTSSMGAPLNGTSNGIGMATPMAELGQAQLQARREVSADFRRQKDLIKSLEAFLRGFKRALQGN